MFLNFRREGTKICPRSVIAAQRDRQSDRHGGLKKGKGKIALHLQPKGMIPNPELRIPDTFENQTFS